MAVLTISSALPTEAKEQVSLAVRHFNTLYTVHVRVDEGSDQINNPTIAFDISDMAGLVIQKNVDNLIRLMMRVTYIAKGDAYAD